MAFGAILTLETVAGGTLAAEGTLGAVGTWVAEGTLAVSLCSSGSVSNVEWRKYAFGARSTVETVAG